MKAEMLRKLEALEAENERASQEIRQTLYDLRKLRIEIRKRNSVPPPETQNEHGATP